MSAAERRAECLVGALRSRRNEGVAEQVRVAGYIGLPKSPT